MDVTLRGNEVVLRPIKPEDAPALFSAASESREHYSLTAVPATLEEARTYIRNALAQTDRMTFAVEWKRRVAGTTSFLDMQTWSWPSGSPMQRSGRPDVVEIGSTWLAASAQHTRCNTAAKLLLLRYAFETWSVHRVTLKTDERNTRSRRAIERLGARFEGIRRAERPATDGTVRNSAYYSIVLSEWPNVRERLEGFLNRD